MKEGYIKKEDRKKILLLTDDIRVHSGVANVGREIVTHTSHRYNWIQMAGAIKHPEKGKGVNISEAINKDAGIEDSSVMLYPVDAYGDPKTLRELIKHEKPDALFLITDPRYFEWLFQIENEIRTSIPIAYLNIWDDLPAPMYNREFYDSCDALFGISKQTVNINKLVLKDCDNSKRVFKYIPHGLNEKEFYPMSTTERSDVGFKTFQKSVLGSNDIDFTLFFNSRNIRRKAIPDTMMAFRSFLDSLPREKALKCRLLLHTELVTDHGTDLGKVAEYLFGEDYEECIVFSHKKVSRKELNYLYNLADCQILLTSNEGWGLTLTEAMLTGTPIIANTTGGMQDQMRFVDSKGKWFEPDADIPSNHRGTFKEHGEWAFPVYPTSRSIQGSPPTPYIYDDRCAWEDACDRIKELYSLSDEERRSRGVKGREWAISDEAGFTTTHQAQRVIEAFDELFEKWEPRETFEIVNATEHKGKFLNHKITY